MKSILHNIIIILFFISLNSCSTTSNFEKANQGRPDWAQSTPIDAFHYLGITSVAKSGVTSQYRQKAKQNALAEIASEISAVVSSNSVLSTIENQMGYSENFNSTLKFSSEEWLEGYELIDAWENEHVYWVYYRLSKQKFAQIQAERKNNAIKSAVNKLSQADKYKQDNNYVEALRFYCQTLVELKPYLAEEVSASYKGVSIDPGATAFEGITTISSSFEFQGPEKITIKIGDKIDENLLTYYLFDNKTGNYLPNIPCRFSYSGLGLLSENEKSKSDGSIKARIPKAMGTKTSEQITVSVDISKLIREISNDIFIRNMAKSLPTAELSTTMQLIAPKVVLSLNDNNRLNQSQKTNIFSSINSELLKNGLQIGKNQSNIDFVLILNIDYNSSTLSNQLKKVDLSGNFIVKNTQEEVVFEQALRKISNTDLTKIKALESGINSLKSQVNINCIRKWHNSQFR